MANRTQNFARRIFDAAKRPFARLSSSKSGRIFALGGAEPEILAMASADRGPLRGRGYATLVPAILAFISVMCAGSIIGIPLLFALPLAVIMSVITLLIDMSIMTIETTKNRALGFVTFAFRVGISVLMSFIISNFIILKVLENDIARQVYVNQTVSAEEFFKSDIVPRYAAEKERLTKIVNDGQAKIDKADKSVKDLEGVVTKSRGQLACETGGVSSVGPCDKTSGNAGYGPNATVAQDFVEINEGRLTKARKALTNVQSEFGPQVEQARKDLNDQNTNIQNEKAAALKRFTTQNGIIAQWNALQDLKDASVTVAFWVLMLELLLIALDMIAVVVAKTIRTLTYKAVLVSMQKQEMEEAALEATRKVQLVKDEVARDLARSTVVTRESELAALEADAEYQEALSKSEFWKAEAERREEAAAANAAREEAFADAEAERREAIAAAKAKAEIKRIEHDAAVYAAKAEAEIEKINLTVAKFAEMEHLVNATNHTANT
jgi:hypothetical protein